MNPISMIITGAANPHVRGYYRFLSETDMIKLQAVADFDQTRLAEAENFFKDKISGIKFYSDWKEMLEKHQDADSVMAGSDNIFHYEQVMHALDMNKHVYSMKVLSMNEKQCKEMIAAAEKKNKILQIELELHFNPQYRQIKNKIAEGCAGKISSIYISNISQSPIAYFPNWGDPVLSYGEKIPTRPGASVYRGGAITDHPHPFDMVRWLTNDEIKKIYAVSGKNMRAWHAVEDHAAITGELKSGIKFFINPSYSHLEERCNTRRLIWPKSLEVLVEVIGSKGLLRTDYFCKPLYLAGKRHASPDRYIMESTAFMPTFQESLLGSFFLAINGKRRIETTGYDGLKAVEAMNASYESIYSAKTVYLS